MSRVARQPLALPKGVELKVTGSQVTVKGAKASLTMQLPSEIRVEVKDSVATIAEDSIKASPALAGSVRAILAGAVKGVVEGYTQKLTLVGVGYRAAAQGKKLNLSLGFSHPVEYPIPDGITVETPSQTEIIVKGADKQKVGQVAADIRGFRPPEPYKGKGVRYATERVILKEAKKK
ncbi:MAG TPA: 50S ribosomal protein L6 [Candidatus Binatia bacterium]|nr:50S ribosomal protein L6 [Candidatus Binatia bacterium]